MAKILDHRSFIKNRSIKINEVFTNDIPWGDSLIGRLINSISRKASISYNNRRISSLIKRLEMHFDQILDIGNIQVEDDVLDYTKISTLLGKLKKQVYDGEDLEIILSTSYLLSDEVDNYNWNRKDEMEVAISNFIEYLKSLGGEVPEDSVEDDNSDEKDDKSSDLDTSELFYSNSIIFLKSIIEISEQIEKSITLDKEVDKKKSGGVEVGKEYYYTNRDGKKTRVKVISLSNVKDIGPDKKWITKDDRNVGTIKKGLASVAFQDEEGKYGSRTNAIDPSKLVPIEESINESRDESRVKSSNAWRKIKSSYLTNVKKHIDYLRNLVSTKDGDPNFETHKGYVIKICKQVLDNNSTVGYPIPYQDLIKEGLIDSDIPKSISLLIKYILPIKSEPGILSFGHLRNSKSSIEKLFTSFENLKKYSRGSNVKNEGLGFQDFIQILEKNKFVDQVKKKFDEIFTEDLVKEFNITEEKKVELETSVKKSEVYRITDFDLVEIARIFNRAFRLHTPGTIPSGRSGGKVSVSVFNEYEYVGQGSSGSPDSPGSGPYQNKKIYDTWRNGVIKKIITNTKYRPLFSEEIVVFSNGKEGSKKKLLTFMTKILEDPDVYAKRGGISDLLLDYFGVKVDPKKTNFGGYDDVVGNQKVSSQIKRTPVDFSQKITNEERNVKGALYKLFLADGQRFASGKEVAYFRSLKIDDKSIWGYLTSDFPYEMTNIRIDTPPSVLQTGNFIICKIDKSSFFSNNKITGSYIVYGQDKKEDFKPISLSKVSILRDTENDTPFTDLRFSDSQGRSENQMGFDKYTKRI